jgi:hypothetical protein
MSVLVSAKVSKVEKYFIVMLLLVGMLFVKYRFMRIGGGEVLLSWSCMGLEVGVDSHIEWARHDLKCRVLADFGSKNIFIYDT